MPDPRQRPTGGVAAWIPYDDLEPLPEGLLANLKKSEERKESSTLSSQETRSPSE